MFAQVPGAPILHLCAPTIQTVGQSSSNSQITRETSDMYVSMKSIAVVLGELTHIAHMQSNLPQAVPQVEISWMLIGSTWRKLSILQGEALVTQNPTLRSDVSS